MADTETLRTLQSLQRQELTIIKLADPVLTPAQLPITSAKRDSNASSQNASDNPTPASLAADLSHYKELFSKLRFSYLEQVTKEKFLRAIVGDPPLIVEQEDNIQLEKELAISKAALKAQKEDVARMEQELEVIGRDLASRYQTIKLQTIQLQTLPDEIQTLENTIGMLKAQIVKHAGDGPENLSLPATLALLAQRDAESEQLDAQLRALQTAIPKKTRELENLQSELRPLEIQKQQAISAAREAIRRKEQAEKGVGDDLEMRGRWYASVDSLMTNVLGADA